MKIFILATIITLFGLAQSGIISETSVDSDYIFYSDEIRVIYNLLAEECPEWRKQEQVLGRRGIITSQHVDVRKRLHDALMNELIKCRGRNSLGFKQKATKPTKTLPAKLQPLITTIPTTTTTIPPMTTAIPSMTTTKPPTTTANPKPVECQNAVNLTGAWRLDTAGQDLRGGGNKSRDGFACDIWREHWFRFSGDGGNKMLNTCPAGKSCGTE